MHHRSPQGTSCFPHRCGRDRPDRCGDSRMIVKSLRLTNLRAIEAAELHFRPGFNLIVGVNGVGKTSVLDALRICMSRLLPAITPSRAKAMSFGVADIRTGFPFLD